MTQRELPSIRSYGNYSSDNYGAHTLEVSIPGLATFYFSYQAVVAFYGPNGRRVSENCWGPTTGKHLNWIDGGNKESRLPRDQFEAELEALGVTA